MKARGEGLPPGIRRRHAGGCAAVVSDDMSVCSCPRGWPHYQAQAGPRSDRQTKTHHSLAAAKSWKRDVERAVEQGHRTAGRAPRLRDAADAWLADAELGVALGRGDKPYKPSTIRGYRRCLEAEVYEEFGARRLDDIGRGELNAFVQTLARRGLAASTIRNIMVPLRALYRQAIALEQVTGNPTRGVQVPGGSGRRERVAARAEIHRLLATVPERDRGLWATALYAGLRRGELMALRWLDVDLAGGVIHVRFSYDPGSKRMVRVKSEAGERTVPICAALRDELVAHRQRAGARPTGLVFARGALAQANRGHRGDTAAPFADSSVARRAERHWHKAGVAPITLHECRHTFASLMIAAMAAEGTFDPKLLQTMLGHTSIGQTFDRYGHLFPGAQKEAARMLDAYLTADLEPVDPVAAAWSQLTAVLAVADRKDALPVVAHAYGSLGSWLGGTGLLPSVTDRSRGCAVQPTFVPRDESGGGS